MKVGNIFDLLGLTVIAAIVLIATKNGGGTAQVFQAAGTGWASILHASEGQ